MLCRQEEREERQRQQEERQGKQGQGKQGRGQGRTPAAEEAARAAAVGSYRQRCCWRRRRRRHRWAEALIGEALPEGRPLTIGGAGGSAARRTAGSRQEAHPLQGFPRGGCVMAPLRLRLILIRLPH